MRRVLDTDDYGISRVIDFNDSGRKVRRRYIDTVDLVPYHMCYDYHKPFPPDCRCVVIDGLSGIRVYDPFFSVDDAIKAYNKEFRVK